MKPLWTTRFHDRAYRRGFVESWFLRINDPISSRAWWLKYTLLRRRDRTTEATLWLTRFDGRVGAAEPVRSWHRTTLSPELVPAPEGLVLPHGELRPSRATGAIGDVAWDLQLTSLAAPLALLQGAYYSPLSPTAKLTTPIPWGSVSGRITLPEETVVLERAPFALGHNWGHRHTRSYAWAQAAGETAAGMLLFEAAGLPADYPEGRPRLTVARIRLGEREIAFNSPGSLLRSRSTVSRDVWSLDASNGRWRVVGELRWRPGLVVRLPYEQPDGTVVTCLNSMVADAGLEVIRRRVGGWERVAELQQHNGAALEFTVPETAPARKVY